MQNTALITGASNGIGRELARIHAKSGGDVIAVATNAERLAALKDELEASGVSVKTIVQDLSAPGAGEAVFEAVEKDGLSVDILINNAGFGGVGYFHERAWENDLAMIQLNIVALTELTRMFLPGFVARNQGRILNSSSTAGLIPGPMQAVYFATKAYVNSFGNALVGELADTNVTVTNLMPGPTETGFANMSGMDKTNLFSNAASAQSVAQDGYDAMMRGDLEVISGLPFSQRLTMRAAPFLPKQMLLKQIKQAQSPRN